MIEITCLDDLHKLKTILNTKPIEEISLEWLDEVNELLTEMLWWCKGYEAGKEKRINDGKQ